jgi:hypothetical protein
MDNSMRTLGQINPISVMDAGHRVNPGTESTVITTGLSWERGDLEPFERAASSDWFEPVPSRFISMAFDRGTSQNQPMKT